MDHGEVLVNLALCGGRGVFHDGGAVPQIPQETVQQVLAATDIVDLIGSYLPLKRGGSGSYVGLCPFHHEKSPSFNVNQARQFFHCFGCGKGGDAIAFVRDYENLPFADAVRKLAARVGIQVAEVESDPHADKARRLRGRLLDVMRETTAWLHGLLMTSPDAGHAREYLKSRGFGREMAEGWTLGWMPENTRLYLDWARTRKFTGLELKESGMAYLRDENDRTSGLNVRFRNRLMIPIRNEVGDVIAFTARQLVEDKNSGKYVNSPETPLFRKSHVLFALDRAKKPMLKEKEALVCEGQIDVISCHVHGFEHAIASQGTAFTQQHARLLKRFTKAAVLCFDADNAGVAAAEKAFRELAPEGISVKVAALPQGDDPDTFLRTRGIEAFRELLSNARPFFDFKIDRALAAGQLGTVEQRTAFTSECAALFAVMSDHTAREMQMHHVTSRLRMGNSPVLRAATMAALKQPQPQHRRDAQGTGTDAEPAVVATPLDRTVGTLCLLALGSAAAQHLLAEQYEPIHEAAEFLAGIPLLERILGTRPDPARPESVNAFTAQLPEEDRMALHTLLRDDHAFEDPVRACHDTLSMLAAKVLLERDRRNKALLSLPDLPLPQQLQLLEEAKEIHLLLDGLKARFITEDILPPPPVKKPPQREWRRKG